jgi:hypothetical protein
MKTNTLRTPHREERIIADVTQHTQVSTRRTAAAEHISHSAAWLVNPEYLLYPKICGDYVQKIILERWILSTAPPALCCWQPISLLLMLWALFKHAGTVNFQNYNSWANAKTHETIPSRHKPRLSMNALGRHYTKCTNISVTLTAMQSQQE